MVSKLDSNQILPAAFDDSSQALNVKAIAGNLITESYDYLALTYVAAGNGAGEVETVTYKSGGSAGTVVATLTLTYDCSNRIASVTKA